MKTNLNEILNKYYHLDPDLRKEIDKRSSPIQDLCALHMYLSENNIRDAIEVGTFKGLSGVFISSAISGVLHTVNINPREVIIAQETAKRFGIDNIRFYVGDSLKMLPEMLSNTSNLGFAYIDGYHSYQYSMGEYQLITSYLDKDKSAVFIDDATKMHPDGKDDGGVPRMVEEISAPKISMCGNRIAYKLFGDFSLL